MGEVVGRLVADAGGNRDADGEAIAIILDFLAERQNLQTTVCVR